MTSRGASSDPGVRHGALASLGADSPILGGKTWEK
jgi:hypothetical protein